MRRPIPVAYFIRSNLQSLRFASFREHPQKISRDSRARSQEHLEPEMHLRLTSVRACTIVAGLLVSAVSTFASPATLCVNPTGTAGCKSTISAAVAAAKDGDLIKVAPGTYAEQVIITKGVAIIGDPTTSPVIDATGFSNGIFINGMAAAPNAGVSNVVINNMVVQNANFEGILIANGTNITLYSNHVHHNNKALIPSPLACPGLPAFETNEGDDCGEGIHLMAVDHSSLVRNEVDHNAGGILISDETGPTSTNFIQVNTVHDNPYDCGITLASHGPATSVIPSAQLPFGISHNIITGNRSFNNGLKQPGAGAGIGIFAPFPGTANYGNFVTGNSVYNNGMPGIAMHNHAYAPAPAPGVNLNDNVIARNSIFDNAADTGDAFTAGTTGINVYSLAPITGLIINENVFGSQDINIALKMPGGSVEAHFNDFNNTGVGIQNAGIPNVGSATVDATDNWWNCPPGSSSNCATSIGPKVNGTVRLPVPFNNLD
jgi:hypothetical protein